MMEHAGRDATLAYRGVGHSNDADDDLEQYLKGILPSRERMYLQKPTATSWFNVVDVLQTRWSNKNQF